MDASQAMLAEMRAALQTLYGPNPPQRVERRTAEKTLLSLRRADAEAAVPVCVALLTPPTDAAAAAYGAQTLAQLCQTRPKQPGWYEATLGLLRAAVEVPHSPPVLTSLSLAICALLVRPPLSSSALATFVSSVCEHLGLQRSPAHAAATLRLFTLVAEELANDRLGLSETHRIEVCEGLQRAAAQPIVDCCVATLLGAQSPAANAPGLGATAGAALGCLSAWVSAELLPWELLSHRALQLALEAVGGTLNALAAAGGAAALGRAPGAGSRGGRSAAEEERARLRVLHEGCALLVAVAQRDEEGVHAAPLLGAVMGLTPGFEACLAAVAAEATTRDPSMFDEPSGAASASKAMAGMFAEVGAAYASAVGGHAELLQLLLHVASSPEPEVAHGVIGSFWAKAAGRAVLAAHPQAAEPLLGALLTACEYPADMAARTRLFWDEKVCRP